jgi:hypothetical protein
MIPTWLAGFHQTRRFEEKWKPIVEHHGYPQSYKLLYYNYTKEECSKLGGGDIRIVGLSMRLPASYSTRCQ